jgi:hypothetical protein
MGIHTAAILVLIQSLGQAKTVVVNHRGSGPGGLKQVLDSLQAGDAVVFNLPRDSETVVIDSQLVLSKSLSIDGSNSAGSGRPVVLKVPVTYGEAKANPLLKASPFRVLKITAGMVSLRNLSIQGGQVGLMSKPNERLGPDDWRGGGIFIAAGDSVRVSMAKVMVSGSGVYDSSDERLSSGSSNAYGGGIYNAGNLILDSCKVTGNRTYARIARGDAVSSGGGIYNAGRMTIRSSVISGNAAVSQANDYWQTPDGLSSGGGIHNQGYLELIASTVHGDSALAAAEFSDMGASTAEGGGLCSRGILRILNSTLHGNLSRSSVRGEKTYSRGNAYALGGGVSVTGSAELVSTTLSGNVVLSIGLSDNFRIGGGLYLKGDSHILNTIVTGNLVSVNPANPTLGAADDVGGEPGRIRAHYSVFGTLPPVDSIVKHGGTWGPGSQRDIPATNLFGTFAPQLADHGGPTQTLSVPARSPAAAHGARVGEYRLRDTTHYNAFWDGNAWKTTTGADLADVTEVTLDQRGVLRGSPPCMGAYYVQGTVNTRPRPPYSDYAQDIDRRDAGIGFNALGRASRFGRYIKP